VPTVPILLKLCSAGSGLIELIPTDGVARVHARDACIFMHSSVDIGALTLENKSCTRPAFDAWSPKSGALEV
jgi:hypothetical protein